MEDASGHEPIDTSGQVEPGGGSARRYFQFGGILLAAALVIGGLTAVVLSQDSAQKVRTGATGREPGSQQGASFFTARYVPDGYSPTNAGSGSDTQQWGPERSDTHEPFALFAPTGQDPTVHNAVLVVATSPTKAGDFPTVYHEIATTIQGTGPEPPPVTVEPDLGAPTTVPQPDGFIGSTNSQPGTTFERPNEGPVYTPISGDRPAELVLTTGPDEAIAVRAYGPDRPVMESFLSASKFTHRSKAPEVAVPDGYELIGFVNADLVLALRADANSAESMPGPPSAKTVRWNRHEGGVTALTTMTVPQEAGDFEAYGLADRFFDVFPEGNFVADAPNGNDQTPALWEESTDQPPCDPQPCRRSVRGFAYVTEWGDLAVLKADGSMVPAPEDLEKMAQQLEVISEADWQAFLDEVYGIDDQLDATTIPDNGLMVPGTGTTRPSDGPLSSGCAGGFCGDPLETGDPGVLMWAARRAYGNDPFIITCATNKVPSDFSATDEGDPFELTADSGEVGSRLWCDVQFLSYTETELGVQISWIDQAGGGNGEKRSVRFDKRV